MKREIVLYKHYFTDFYKSQDERTKKKIDYVLNIVRVMDKVPEQYLKHLEGTDGLYEARVKLASNIYRIVCFLTKEI